MADIITNTLQIGSNNLVLRDADAQAKVAVNTQDITSLKEDLNQYINGVDAQFNVESTGVKKFDVLLLKGVRYKITNNTSGAVYWRLYKSDGTSTSMLTLNANSSTYFFPDDNDYVQVGGYFDGTGTFSVYSPFANHDVKITPEMFGAVGDGVTNDYTAFQLAVNYCITNNVPLFLMSNSVYAIGTKILFQNPSTNFHMYGNGATIKALSGYNITEWHEMLYFDQDNLAYTNMTYFSDFVVDCNEVCSGIWIDYGFHFAFKNVRVINTKNSAIVAKGGGGVYFNNVEIYCLHNNGSSTGIQVESSDYHFTDFVIIDADRAIYNKSSSMYTRVHAWNTSGCSGTYYFVHNSGYPILIQCHADTFETGYYRETDRPMMLIGCVFYINSNLYDSSAVPVIFKFTTSALSYSGNIKCVNCVFDALRTEVNMTESAHRIQLVNCSKKGTINRFENGVSLKLSNGVLDDGLSVNRNKVTQDGDKMAVNLILDVSSITFSGSAITIGTIPISRFFPSAFVVFPCLFCNDDYGTNYVSGYITVNNNNGYVQVKPNANGTYKKLVADFYYDKPLKLYEA